MRPIKFRAWDALTNRMQYFTFDDLLRGHVDGLHPASCDWYLMQFTGLLDRNGKEIYEGDIVAYSDQLKGAVKWIQDKNAGGWGMDNSEIWFLVGVGISEGEIIGNIYESPEGKEGA